MASGPRRGNSSGSVGAGGAYDQSHVCRYRGLRGKGVGRRPSAVGRKAETLGIRLWDSIRWLRFSAGEWLELEALPGYQAANGWSP